MNPPMKNTTTSLRNCCCNRRILRWNAALKDAFANQSFPLNGEGSFGKTELIVACALTGSDIYPPRNGFVGYCEWNYLKLDGKVSLSWLTKNSQ
jgi:hypothetical protein